MPGDVTVTTIMTSDVITLSPEQTVPEAADVLAEHHIGAAPVIDGGKLVGLLRDEDLIVSEAKLHVPTVIEFLGAELVWPKSEKRWEAELKKAAASTVADVMTTDVPDRLAHRQRRGGCDRDARPQREPRLRDRR